MNDVSYWLLFFTSLASVSVASAELYKRYRIRGLDPKRRKFSLHWAAPNSLFPISLLLLLLVSLSDAEKLINEHNQRVLEMRNEVRDRESPCFFAKPLMSFVSILIGPADCCPNNTRIPFFRTKLMLLRVCGRLSCNCGVMKELDTFFLFFFLSLFHLELK